MSLAPHPQCAYDTAVRPVVWLRHFVIAQVVIVACARKPAPPPARGRVDAAIRRDVPATARRADATAQRTDAAAPDAAPDAADVGVRRPRLSVWVVGGGGLVREGAPVQIRVVRHRGAGEPDVEVTRGAVVRVEPADRGNIDNTRTFRGRGRGRVEIVAALDGDEARTIVDVSDEMPPGTSVLPMFQASGGPVALAIWFEARPGGAIWTRMEFVDRSLTLEGRRTGRSFPITVPVSEDRPRGGATRPPLSAGVLVLDQWAAGRLDGHGTLRLDGQPIQVRFSVMVFDPALLTDAPAAGGGDGGP